MAVQNNDVLQFYEGGQKLDKTEERLHEMAIKHEASKRVQIAEQVQPTAWHSTLFYGLKLNHPHNIALVQPLSFVLRRVLFALLITNSTGESALFSAGVLQLTCLFMLAMVCSEVPWVDSLSNQQHFVNEVIIYLICACLMILSGVVTSME